MHITKRCSRPGLKADRRRPRSIPSRRFKVHPLRVHLLLVHPHILSGDLMLIIPEHRAVLILPPRTGSTSIKEAVRARYPCAKSLYRHMERDSIPAAFRDWAVIGIVREPLARLHSLYRYMQRIPETSGEPGWRARIAADTRRPFEDWLLRSTEPFNDPSVTCGRGDYYAVRHVMPITRKSQFAWLRPDLGPIEILNFEDIGALETRLDIRMPHRNASRAAPRPPISAAARQMLKTWHGWDLALYGHARRSAAAALPEDAAVAA